MITRHLTTYRASRNCFSAIIFHDYLHYYGIFLARFLITIVLNIISSLHTFLFLCARVGWCDVGSEFTNLRWLVPVSSRELVTLIRNALKKSAKGARDLKGEKFKTNMAARGFFRSTKLLSYFVRSLPTSVYLMYSTATVYAGDRNENKEDDSRRHKGCFASKRKIQSIRNLATAKKERPQVKENLPEEEKDCESPRKIKARSHQVIYVCYIAVAFRLVRLSFVTFSSFLFFF